ncbi:MAG: hypothetical protein HOM11_07575 [Methylococcales bacterium]|jgi:hypothetical protein|nr:hypothetical protein [Methylococcales bacterium]
MDDKTQNEPLTGSGNITWDDEKPFFNEEPIQQGGGVSLFPSQSDNLRRTHQMSSSCRCTTNTTTTIKA